MEKWSVKLSTYDIKYEPRSTIKGQALVDFRDDLRAEVEIKANKLLEEENVGRWTLFTDGTGLGLGVQMSRSEPEPDQARARLA